MKFRIIKIVVALSGLLWSMPMMAQFDFMRAMSALSKVTQAATISDDQVAAYVKEYVMYMDEKNNVAGPSDPYTVRLDRLTAGLIEVEGIPLNFKVYKTKDVNAFACADGSVRVFSSLMDIMSDDELLGVIGHEIGHVAHHDSKKGFKQALLSSALRDGLASGGGTVALLSQSQLGDLGEALASANYSQKQEKDADDYGYEFLKSHGKNPMAMVLSFKKLKAIEASSGAGDAGPINQLFSSHPDLDDRIERMASRAIKDGYSATSVPSTSKGKVTPRGVKKSSDNIVKTHDHAPGNSVTSPEWTF
jgi:putative metalloprotease